MSRSARGLMFAAVVSVPAFVGACSTPMSRTGDDDLRRSVAESAERELTDARRAPASIPAPAVEDRLGFSPARVEELDSISGVGAYGVIETPFGPNLLGEETRTVGLSLQQAVLRAVRHNLSGQVARLDAAASQADVTAADALFDWVFFADATLQTTDAPSAVPVIGNVPIGTGINKNKSYVFDAGLRRRLTTGGRVELEQSLSIFNNQSPGQSRSPDPARTARLNITLDQPLMRGFGADVALAEVRLARNFERASLETLRDELIGIATEAERAYWNVVRAHREAQIQASLLARGIETRDVLANRLSFDVRPAEFSDAVAQVESRRANLIRAINTLRKSSDALKVILNDPSFPVGSEVVVLPADEPTDAAIEVSLLDSLETALAQRPDVQRAILAIDDASIRETVADNARLPRLDLRIAATLTGLDDTASGAFDELRTGDFTDWLAGLAFERPIGNRAAEAGFRRARLERVRSAVSYRAVVQRAVAQVKDALRDVATNRALIEQTRIARLAAAENLRTLLIEEQNIRGLTPEFLNLKLTRQQSLAAAESAEILARVDYNIAIADLHRAIGTALERSGVRFVAPEFDEVIAQPDAAPIEPAAPTP